MKKLIVLCLALPCLGLFLACSEKEDTDTAQQADPSRQEQKADVESAANLVVDPVCSMKFKEEEAAATAEHSGETYFFCMQEHKETFVADPDKYLAKVDEPKQN